MKTFKITFTSLGLVFATAFGSYLYVSSGSNVMPAAQAHGLVAASAINELSAASIDVVENTTSASNASINSVSTDVKSSTQITAGTAAVSTAKSETTTGMSGTVVSSVSAIVGDQTPSTTHFQNPVGITIDASGNLYVTDASRHIVRKITTSLVVSTFAGSSGSAGNINGLGTAARFNAPKGIAYSSSGGLYVADSGNASIRKVASDGTVTTLASAAGDSLAVDSGGNAYVGDSNADLIRKVTPSGTVASYAGVSAGNSGIGKIDTYVVSGDIDPVDPTWRSYQFSDSGDQTAGLAPVAITQGLYGVRLELTEDTPATIAYTTTDFPNSGSWGSQAVPYTATYGRTWVIPIMAFHSGTDPISRENDAFLDSQLWGGLGGTDWLKQSANVVLFATGGGSPENYSDLERLITLTFTSAHSGTFTTQYGLYPSNVVVKPGVTPLSKVLTTTSGHFVINRTSQIVPTQNDVGLYSGFWIE